MNSTTPIEDHVHIERLDNPESFLPAFEPIYVAAVITEHIYQGEVPDVRSQTWYLGRKGTRYSVFLSEVLYTATPKLWSCWKRHWPRQSRPLPSSTK